MFPKHVSETLKKTPSLGERAHKVACEGTGTRQDYLVNRDDKKIEGPFGEKICTKIEK